MRKQRHWWLARNCRIFQTHPASIDKDLLAPAANANHLRSSRNRSVDNVLRRASFDQYCGRAKFNQTLARVLHSHFHRSRESRTIAIKWKCYRISASSQVDRTPIERLRSRIGNEVPDRSLEHFLGRRFVTVIFKRKPVPLVVYENDSIVGVDLVCNVSSGGHSDFKLSEWSVCSL